MGEKKNKKTQIRVRNASNKTGKKINLLAQIWVRCFKKIGVQGWSSLFPQRIRVIIRRTEETPERVVMEKTSERGGSWSSKVVTINITMVESCLSGTAATSLLVVYLPLCICLNIVKILHPNWLSSIIFRSLINYNSQIELQIFFFFFNALIK